MLLLAVKSLLQQYGDAHGYDWEPCYHRLYKEAFKNDSTVSALKKNAAHAAQYLWTSAQRMKKLTNPTVDVQHTDSPAAAAAATAATPALPTNSIELCSVINAAIRADEPKQIIHVVTIVRGINKLCVTQNREDSMWAAPMPFPKGGVCYRGTGFDNKFRDFYTVGKKYRVPVCERARVCVCMNACVRALVCMCMNACVYIRSNLRA